MYSRDLGSEFPSLAKLAGNYKGHHSDQRISVISNTSSNTTSGIVSDRVQSLDESEDDLEIEIMINSPPAPSVESLALAHLRDAPDVLQARGSSAPSPRSHCSKGKYLLYLVNVLKWSTDSDTNLTVVCRHRWSR